MPCQVGEMPMIGDGILKASAELCSAAQRAVDEKEGSWVHGANLGVVELRRNLPTSI